MKVKPQRYQSVQDMLGALGYSYDANKDAMTRSDGKEVKAAQLTKHSPTSFAERHRSDGIMEPIA